MLLAQEVKQILSQNLIYWNTRFQLFEGDEWYQVIFSRLFVFLLSYWLSL